MRRDDLGGRASADQRTCGDDVDRAAGKRRGGAAGLRKPKLVEGNVGVALETALDIPVGLAVPQEVKAAFGDRQNVSAATVGGGLGQRVRTRCADRGDHYTLISSEAEHVKEGTMGNQ